MAESKREGNNPNDHARQKPDSDATSKETLSDVQETEKESGSTDKHDSGPSPDGAFDESGETNDAGPM